MVQDPASFFLNLDIVADIPPLEDRFLSLNGIRGIILSLVTFDGCLLVCAGGFGVVGCVLGQCCRNVPSAENLSLGQYIWTKFG